MKKLAKLYMFTVLLFVALFVTANMIFASFVKKNNEAGNILMNRAVEGIRKKYMAQTIANNYIDPLPGAEI